MKTIRNLILSLITASAFFTTSPAFAEPKLSTEGLQYIISTMKESLPMQVDEGIVWQSAELTSDKSSISIVFKIYPSEMGLTLEETKKSFNDVTNEEFKTMLGKEFDEMMTDLGCPFIITLQYPDNTSKRFYLKP